MNRIRSMTLALALTTALTAPVLAQTASGPASGNTPAATGTTGGTTGGITTNPGAPTMGSTTGGMTTGGMATGDSNKSTYMTANRDVRASKVIGASVYNDHDQKIGTIDELLMNPNHDVTAAVLSVGGFLGIASKLVSVKIDQIQVRPDRVVMSGATKDGLTRMPAYEYANGAS